MQKPKENGNIKPLIVNDDNVYELTASEISCPKETDEPIHHACALIANTKCMMPHSKRLSSDVESDQLPSSTPHTGAGTYSGSSIVSTTGVTAKCHNTLANQKTAQGFSSNADKEICNSKKMKAQRTVVKTSHPSSTSSKPKGLTLAMPTLDRKSVV